jgi:SAM-dependent methyltransferase
MVDVYVVAKFDRYESSYEADLRRSMSFARQDHEFFTELKARELRALVERYLGDPRRMRALDFGCGVGLTDKHLSGRFASLDGVDVSAAEIERAAAANADVTYRAYDGVTLPYRDGSFDVAFAICVLHHVEPSTWAGVAAELSRVVRPGGLVVVFEHNPVHPLTRLVVSRCAFDDGVTLLRPSRIHAILRGGGLRLLESRYVIFFPWRGGVFRKLEHLLRRLPFGAQYAVAARR